MNENQIVHGLPRQPVFLVLDNETGICYNYTYDKHGNVTEVLEKDSATGATLRTNAYVYDTEAHNKVLSTTYGATGQTYIPIYEQNSAGDRIRNAS